MPNAQSDVLQFELRPRRNLKGGGGKYYDDYIQVGYG